MKLPEPGALAAQRHVSGELVPAGQPEKLHYHLVVLEEQAKVRWHGTSLCGLWRKDWMPYDIGVEPSPDLLCGACDAELLRRRARGGSKE